MSVIVERPPELEVEHWLNSDAPISLESLTGRVVVLEAFQMLCPGCVSHSLPQAVRVSELFNPKDVIVLGLHTVFEHHHVQGTRAALQAFLHEYRIAFPVAIDAPSEHGPIPRTMAKYNMQGTPTTILIDKTGRLRKQSFGRSEDLELGAEIMSLVGEVAQDMQRGLSPDDVDPSLCDENGCPVG